MTNERKAELDALCLQFRNDLIDLLHKIQTGHPGGSLSSCEIITTLYHEIMNIDPKIQRRKTEIILFCQKVMQHQCCI